jgi:peptidoglycan/xylan/chitin deacetylase (PgdA/CDA1 family)
MLVSRSSAQATVWSGPVRDSDQNMKRTIKRMIGHALRPVRQDWDGYLAVLNYHSIGGGAVGSQSAARFREQIAWLSRHHKEFPVCGLREIPHGPTGEDNGTAVVITFDDGYRDNAEVAAPILEEFNFRGVFFVTSAFVDGNQEIVRAFKSYAGLPNMTWDHVAGLVDRGHEVGVHGHRHPNYAGLSRAEAEDDFARSVESVRSQVGISPKSFAYPFGQWRHQRRDFGDIFRRFGIEYVFTTTHRRIRLRDISDYGDGMFGIPRLRIDPEDSLAVFREKIFGLWDWVAAVQRMRSWARGYRVSGL